LQNEFIIDLVGKLEQKKTKKQLKEEIKTLEQSLDMVRLVGAFNKRETRKALNEYIRQLSGSLATVKLKTKLDNKKLQSEIDQALSNIKLKDIEALDIDENKIKLKLRKLFADVKAYTQKNPVITIDIDLKKQKLMNDFTAYLNRNSKISESGVLLKEAEKLRGLIGSVEDSQSLKEATEKIRVYKSEVAACGYNTKGTADKIKHMLYHVSKISSLFGVASLAIGNFKKSMDTLKTNDTILTEISKTSNLAASELERLGDSAFGTAGKYGKLSSDYLTSIQEMYRSGYDNSEQMAELSVAAQGAGDMTADLANQYIIATDKAYKMNGSIEMLTETLDGANNITNNNAVNMTELAAGMSIVGSTAASLGVDVDETTAALGTMIASTQQSGSEVARAFKAILLNIRQVSDEEEGIDAEGLTKYEEACNALNVKLKDTKNGVLSLRDPMDVLKELSAAYNKLSETDIRRTNLLNSVGGKLRSTQLDTLLRQWDTYEKQLQQYADGAGSMAVEAEKTANSWEGRLNSLQNSWDRFVSSLTDKGAVKGGITLLDNLLQVSEGLVDTLGELPVILTAVGAGMTALNKDYGITQLRNKETGKMDIQGNFFGIDITAIKAQKKHFAEADDAISGWNSKLLQGQTDIDDFNNSVVQNNEHLKEYLKTTSKEAPGSLNGYQSYLNSVGVSTDALRLKTILLNSALSFGMGLLVQAVGGFVIGTINEIANAEEIAAEKAKELGSQFSSTKSDISDYKTRIEELYAVINDNTSSYEETYDARQKLLAIQDEMISKFGDEAEAVGLVTDAIDGQTDALDLLTQQEWQETVNDFNSGADKKWYQNLADDVSNLFNGASNNFERMKNEMENKTISFNLKIEDSEEDEYIEAYEEFIEKLKEIYDIDIRKVKKGGDISTGNTNKIEISGNIDDVYNKLLGIQNLAETIGYSSFLRGDFSDTIKSLKKTRDAYKEIYNQYILYDKILNDESYEASFNEITNAYKEYTKAFAEGDPEAKKAAIQNYAEIVQQATEGIEDESVVDYFNTMYPELQEAVGKWNFEVTFNAALNNKDDNFENDVKGYLEEFHTAEDIIGYNPNITTRKQAYAYEQLKLIAHDYGLEIDKLAEKLAEMGLLSSQTKEDLLDKLIPKRGLSAGATSTMDNFFGQTNADTVKEWVSSLTEEEAKLANSKEFEQVLEEQKATLNGAKLAAEHYAAALQAVTDKQSILKDLSLTFTEILSGSIGIETIDDYTEKINTLQSYLDKFKDGSYSPADKLSLATDFGITGDSVEDITNQIQKLMDTEMDTITAKIDEILNTKNLNETTRKELENLKQTLEDVAKEAQNTASFPLTGNALADVQKLTEGLDQLDQIYADVYDKEDFDWSSILNNEAFSKTFGEYTEEYNNFLDTISKSPDDIAACQEAFNQLTGAYIYGSGVLNEVTESTKDATIQMLEQMGVANAQEIVMKALAAQEAFLAAKKKDSSIQSENLAEATWQEIQAVLAEGEAAEETQSYLAQLALSKLDITNNPINTDEDVKAIIAIANAAGTSQGYVAALQTALENLVKAQEDVKKIQNTEVSGSFADAAKGAALGGAKAMETSAKKTAEKFVTDIEKHIYKNKLNPEQFLADYKGGSATKSAIEKAEKEKEKEKKDAEKSKSEKQIDFFEYRLKELDQAIDTVETHMNNFTGSAAKNLAIDTLIQIDAGKQSDLHKSLSLYTHMAEEELAKIPEQFQEMAKNGAINITDFIETADDENGTIAEAIENYRKWADKVDEVSLSIEELNTTMRQLELDKFKNIAADYTKLLDQITQSTSRLETLMDTQEKISGTKSRAYYEELMGKTQIQLDYLQKEKSALEQQIQNAVTSGIQVGSDEWAEMKSSLADIDSQIIQCVGSMEDFADSIREIDVSNFEKVMSSFDRIETEIDRLLSLSENDVVVDDKGNLTQSALTQIGLLGEKYTIALRKAEEYKKGLESLDQAYAAGKLNFTEYLELHNQLNDGLTDSLQAQKDAKDAVFKFKQQVIDKEIENINKARDAYKEYIDAKKEALDRESDSYDFNKEMADLRKELTSLDTQIGQLTGDDDYTLAKKAELQQQRKDKQEELDNKLYKRSIDQQKEALDKQYEDYSADCDRRIEIAEKSAEQITENIEREFNNLMQEVSQNADQCLAGINQLCSKYGIKVSENLTEPWKEGEHALGIYHGKMDFHTGAFNSMLDDVKQHIYDDGREADNTAQKLIDTFGLRADTLNHELSLVWDGLNSDRERSAALSDSLWNTFNTHSSAPLVGQLNNAETAAWNTSGAVGSIEGAAQRSSGAVNQIAREAGGVRDTINDASQSVYELGENFKSAADTASRALDQLIQIGVSIPANMAKATTRMLQETSNAIQNATNAVINTGINAMMSGTANRNSLAAGLAMLGGGSGFAEGGVITKKDDYLTPLAKSKGEDTAIFAKYGERVLTKEENQEFEAYEAAKEEITPTLNKATPVQTVDDLPVIDLVKYKEVFLKEHPNYYMEHLNINLDNLTGKNAIQNIDNRNIDNSINFNGALIEVKGDMHRDDMKTMEKVAQKEIKRALDKQNAALRTYMGI